MVPALRLATQARDLGNQPFRNTVELTFQKTMAMWPLNYNKTKSKLFADGRSNWKRMRGVWYTQVLFQNLHTCLYGAESTGVFHIYPPTVEEYLHSINNGLMVASPTN
jgi:hypothetical protein